MEDVLEVYRQPSDALRPQVCVDEGSMPFIKDPRDPLAMKAGKVKREDDEYEREGFCPVCLACEPLSGKRFVPAKTRRTKVDFALFMKELSDMEYPEAAKLVLVLDNLNIHTPGSCYHVFPPQEAMRLWHKLEIHSTPLHGSWLNMAEIELSVLGRQALSGHLPDLESVQQRRAAWQTRRNMQQASIDGRCTAQDSRSKLKRLYPSIEV